MKAYTDIEQSKMLAEILPIESADMYYWCGEDLRIGSHKAMDLDYDIPCWSLAALLMVLPYPHLEQNYKGKWCCRTEYADTTYLWEADNSVDACYEMVLKLHEQKLL